MSDDIEEFLRRAAARRQQRQGQPPQRPMYAPPPPPDIEIIEPVEADIVEAVAADESVAEHVSHYLAADEFQQRASHLGEEVGQADEHLKSHLTEVFEHRVGDLGSTSMAVEMAAVDTIGEDIPTVTRDRSGATDIVKMFRSPASMRQAILLSEIMHRPEGRW
jgi:hypothetical protein